MSVFLLAGIAWPAAAARGAELELTKGDHICLIGNTLAERMQHHGWLETLLHNRFPDRELVVRSLGFSGDELTTRLRSAGFGTPDEHLAFNKADVIFAFFGYNESFGGTAGLEKFKNDLGEFIRHTLGQKYNGKSAPRLVLFSPIAHEDLHDPNLPDGRQNNERLDSYTRAMSEVARANGARFVDLFQLSRELYRQADSPLTINGVHLNERGDKLLAAKIDTALFGQATPARPAPPALEKLRAAVLEKNFYWFERYRTVDGYSIYGGRADLKFVDDQTNREVMQRELAVLDVMTANRDKKIWAIAQGKPARADDANTPPFIPVKTNKPGNGPDGAHLFVSGEEAIDLMRVAEGMRVNLFASEETFPDLAKPVQMAFDPSGRLWVAVMPSYPHWKPKEEMNDKVLILEDTDGDGRADRCTVFADKLHVPTGLEFFNGGLLVGQQPDLMFLKDTDGDGVADYRERVLHGVDSADTHHALNSFTLDPGGALYFQEGTFHHTQVETPWGPPERCANAGVFRYEPRTQKFDVYVSYGFANPHGHVFDHWGQDFVTDGTGNVNYFAAGFSGHVDFPRKHESFQPYFNQRTRPCAGTEILSSRHFPDENQGNLLIANVIGFQGILQYRYSEQGSGFVGSEVEPIVQSSDPNFRPTDIEIGPDGAIYFLDWQNPIIGHMQHNLRDPSRDRTHGRVYRVTHATRPLMTPARIAGQPIERLLELLKEPEDRVRYRTRIELGSRPSADVIAALGLWIGRLDKKDPNYEHHLLEGLWAHQYQNVVNESLLERLLRSPDYRARAAATRVACYWRDRIVDPLALLARQAEDEHPRVRLEAVRAASFFREARAADVALAALRQSTDYYINYALKETLTTLEPYWKPALTAGRPLAERNPAGFEHLLARLSTADLVKLSRSGPVYQALLSRDGVLPDIRKEALEGLAKTNRTDFLTELFAAIQRIDASENLHAAHVLSDLASLMAARPAAELATIRPMLEKLSGQARQAVTRQVALVTMATADGGIDRLWKSSATSVRRLVDLVDAVPLIPDAKLRTSAYDRIAPLLTKLPDELAAGLKNRHGVPGRFVRIELPGEKRTLTLAEVEVLSNGANIARQGKATQSTTANGGAAERAIDGNSSGFWGDAHQTHTVENQKDPWWQLDLGSDRPIEAIAIWNRTDGELGRRLDGFRLVVRDTQGRVVYERSNVPAPAPTARLDISDDPAGALRRSAMNAVTAMPGHEADAFKALAEFIIQGNDRDWAVRAIRRIPRSLWPHDQIRRLLAAVLAHVSGLAADARAEPAGLDALQLGKDLATLLPAKEAKDTLARLGELGVNVILIRTVPHRMIYDRQRIYVEAGKPAVIVLENADIMPHNLLIGAPGSLVEIGLAAENMASQPDAVAKNFVPQSPKVMHAMRMVQPRESVRMTFTAPAQVGEYPYVCTFPGHWRLMYGTMHVVPKLSDISPDELNPPTETFAEGRPFVRKWTVDELAGELHHLEHGRTFERGKALFAAATCVKCHKMAGQGGAVGPDLAEVKTKIAEKKHTPESVLREMIEPSKVIDPKFKTYIIETTRGEVVSGIIVSQTDKTLKVQANPDAPPRELALTDVDEKIESKVSLMPEGLLVTLTKDEILDLLAYVLSGGDPNSPAFAGGNHK
ncbi:MAG TPA: PVC-type heme-binding CxxCH protein [Planctomycetaceae bacterium]|nr:PVC-type heme-binding CxxCH protein [Planctomycetaceae bacterium]